MGNWVLNCIRVPSETPLSLPSKYLDTLPQSACPSISAHSYTKQFASSETTVPIHAFFLLHKEARKKATSRQERTACDKCIALMVCKGQAANRQEANQKNSKRYGWEESCAGHSQLQTWPYSWITYQGQVQNHYFRKNAPKNEMASVVLTGRQVWLILWRELSSPSPSLLKGQRFVCKIAQAFPCGQRPVFYLFGVSTIGLVSHFAVVLHYLIKSMDTSQCCCSTQTTFWHCTWPTGSVLWQEKGN